MTDINSQMTIKQLGRLRELCRKHDLDLEIEANISFRCEVKDLTRHQAAELIAEIENEFK